MEIGLALCRRDLDLLLSGIKAVVTLSLSTLLNEFRALFFSSNIEFESAFGRMWIPDFVPMGGLRCMFSVGTSELLRR